MRGLRGRGLPEPTRSASPGVRLAVTLSLRGCLRGWGWPCVSQPGCALAPSCQHLPRPARHPQGSRGADLEVQLLRDGGVPAWRPQERCCSQAQSHPAGVLEPVPGQRSAWTPPLGDWPAQGGGCWPGFCCLTQTRCGGWGRGAGFPGGPVPRLPAPLGRAPPPDPPPAHWAGTGALTPGLALPLLARPPWVHSFPPLASSSLARPAPTLGVGGEAAVEGKRGGGSGVSFLPASSFPWVTRSGVPCVAPSPA